MASQDHPIVAELRRLRADWLKALDHVESSGRPAIEKRIALIDKVLACEREQASRAQIQAKARETSEAAMRPSQYKAVGP